MKNYIIISFLLISSLFSVYAQNPEWLYYNRENSGLPSQYINAIAIDSSGNKWFGSDYYRQLVKFDGNKWTIYNNDSLLQIDDNIITSILIEDSLTIWVGTVYGIVKYDGVKWTHYTDKNSGLLFSGIYSLAIDNSGGIWVGLQFSTIANYNNNLWTSFINIREIPQESCAIAIDSSGNKWIGLSDYHRSSGIGVFSKYDDKNWISYTSDTSGFPSSHGVLSIAIDKEQNKWIGTLIGGLVKYNDTIWTVYNTKNSGIPDNIVNTIAIDDLGNKWIGTNQGLAKFDGTNWTVWNSKNSGLTYNWIKTIAIDKYGNKWIGTNGGGIFVFKEGGVISVGESHQKEFTTALNCYPNPFSETTTIKYSLSYSSHIIIKVIDIFGNKVAVLVNEYKKPGNYKVHFTTSSLPSGNYFYQLQTPTKLITKKFIILK